MFHPGWDDATSNGRKRARRFGPFQRTVEVGAGGQQLTTSNVKHGKKLARRELLMRLLSAKLNRVNHRWQNITNSASGTGAYILNYFLDTAAAQSSFIPVYLFDLSCAQQQIIDGVQTFGCPASRLRRNGISNDYFTEPVLGRNSDDNGDAAAWTLERNAGLTNTKEYEQSLIETVSIKLLLYGARKFPSQVKVQIVSFSEGYTPNAYQSLSVAGPATVSEAEPSISGTDEALFDWNAMWMQHVAPLIGNPIGTRPYATRQLMKVHKSKTYDFQPKESIDLDITGDQVAVFFNYKMYKTVDYTRSQTVSDVTVAEEANPNEWSIRDSKELEVHARPEQRMFLMVSAMTSQNTFGVPSSADIAPSMDICLRRKISSVDV